MKDVPELLDMLAAPKDNSADKDKIVYEEVRHNFENSTIQYGKFTLSNIYVFCSIAQNRSSNCKWY